MKTPSAGRALAALALSMLLSSLGTSLPNVALPALASAFRAPFAAVQWVVLAYLVAVTGSVVGVGRLGDLFGRRRLLLAGVLVFTLASLACGLSPTLGLLVAARAAQGVGGAIMLALALALVREVSKGTRTGRLMGLLGSTSAIGTALGPPLGGLLVAGLGWRAVFLAIVPLGLVTAFLVHRFLPADRPASVSRDGSRGFGVSLLALVREPVLAAGLLASLLVAAVLMATLVVGPFYLSRALGLDAGRVGLVMAIGPAVAALAGVPAGRLVDRFGTQGTTLAGLLGIAAGCFVLCVAPGTLAVAGYALAIGIVTAHYALFQAANNTAVMRGAGAGQQGLVSGMLNLSRNLGLVAGTSLLGAVFAAASGAPDVAAAEPAAVAAGMRVAFGVAAALVVAAIAVLALAMRARYVWDYDISEQEFDALLAGRATLGRLDRAWAAARLIDSAPYEEVVRRIGFGELVRHWPEWRSRVRSSSARRGLDFLVEWLPRHHPDLVA